MIVVVVLVIWGTLAAISVATDLVFMFRDLTGRSGEDALALARATAARAGGVRRWVLISLAFDIFMPWQMWQGLLS